LDCNVLQVANHRFIIIGSCVVCAEGQIRRSYTFVVNSYSLADEVRLLTMPE
jgi:hypothetical protein